MHLDQRWPCVYKSLNKYFLENKQQHLPFFPDKRLFTVCLHTSFYWSYILINPATRKTERVENQNENLWSIFLAKYENTTETYCSVAFKWMVALKDFIHRLLS